MTKPTNVLPPPPDLVLRLGFAGNRKLAHGAAHLDQALDEILTVAARELTNVLPADRATSDKIARHYSAQPPRVRLITGLAEGADERAAAAIERLAQKEESRAEASGVVAAIRAELAAVLPFDTATYAASRDPEFRHDFVERHQQCAYVLELDGIHAPKRDGETRAEARRRERAYRMQSALLLRHADILLAAADREAASRPGGTLETIAAALAFDTPVVFIDLSAAADASGKVIYLLEPGTQFRDALDDNDTSLTWQEQLAQWVQRIAADPDFVPPDSRPLSPAEQAELEQQHRQGDQFVTEYFNASDRPRTDAKGVRRPSFRERVWGWFEAWFRDAGGPTRDPRLEPFGVYRDRATGLNYHFSGLYRGAFVLNYALAVAAVFLATLSVVLIVEIGEKYHELLERILGVLVLFKLTLLVYIFRNTSRANAEHWNDKAIDYRYLAERLRAMFYLPRLGSFQSPSAAHLNYASRFARQSGIDWLFEAICRSVSPARFASGSFQAAPESRSVPTLKVDVDGVLADVRDHWIGAQRTPEASPPRAGAGQILYHQRNGNTMRRLYGTLNECVHWLNFIVVAVVAVDLLTIFCRWDEQHAWSPWLVFAAALLPAAVASLNGLRFQSECQRLADRSRAILRLLEGRSAKARELQTWINDNRNDMNKVEGAYTMKVLTVSEGVAKDLVEEVAEWSVLYAKDVTDT